MKLDHLKPFVGEHCETTATGTLLQQLGIELSEPMLFGLGEGLGFIFWKMKTMDFPFIGGRIKPDQLTQNIARNLNLELIAKETSSSVKAWAAVKELLDGGQAVGLKLDCFYLEYFTRPFHFAGHYVAIYGYDNHYAYLVDTRQQGGQVKTSLESLALARAEKGPMGSKNLYYYLKQGKEKVDLKKAVRAAIKNNAKEYIHPPIANIGYKGILKTGAELTHWFATSKDVANEFGTTAMLMEKAGTGGALFRNLYRDFLRESYALIGLPTLKKAHLEFIEIASRWTEVAQLLEKVSLTRDITYVHQASALLKTIAGQEKTAMEQLAGI